MKNYLLLFRNLSGNGQFISTPEDMVEDMPKWQAWVGNIAMQGKLIATEPIFWEGKVVSHRGISETPHLADNQLIVGYILCKTDKPEEVQEWAKTCPVLKYPQASVEIRETMPFAV